VFKVYAYFDGTPENVLTQAGFARAWDISWSRYGWDTKLLTATDAKLCPLWTSKTPPALFPFHAMIWRDAQFLAPLSAINCGLRRPRQKPVKTTIYYNDKGEAVLYFIARTKLNEIIRTGVISDHSVKKIGQSLQVALDADDATAKLTI